MATLASQKIGQISTDYDASSINSELDHIHERVNAQMENGDKFVGRRVIDQVVYALAAGDSYLGIVHSQAAVTIVLPKATEAYVEKEYTVKDEANIAATKNVTITAQQGEKIDKAQTVTISTNLGIKRFFSTGQEWFTI